MTNLSCFIILLIIYIADRQLFILFFCAAGIFWHTYWHNVLKQINMRNVVQYEGIKLWVDQDVIHCKLRPDFFKNYEKDKTEEALFNAISILYDREYRPLLLDLKQINSTDAIEIFMLISNSVPINTLVLSRAFLVRSTCLKFLLALNNITGNRVVPNRIYTDFDLALLYCKNKYKNFNTVSQGSFT